MTPCSSTAVRSPVPHSSTYDSAMIASLSTSFPTRCRLALATVCQPRRQRRYSESVSPNDRGATIPGGRPVLMFMAVTCWLLAAILAGYGCVGPC